MPTVIVEDGSGIANSNSYASVADTDAYLSNLLDANEWSIATDDQKAAAVISATMVINNDCRFRGFRKSMTQALEWPRIRARNDDFYGQMPGRITALLNVYYDESSIPLPLKQATYQVALDLLRDATRARDNTAIGIKSASIGQNALAITFDQARLPVPLSMEAQRLLQKLIISFRYGLGTVKLVRVQ